MKWLLKLLGWDKSEPIKIEETPVETEKAPVVPVAPIIVVPAASTSAPKQPSKQAIDLLKAIEKLATKPYDDQTGSNITEWCKGATIGYGHLISKEDWVKYKNGLQEEGALALFNEDLVPFVQLVNNAVHSNISQQQFDALLIFAYNIGPTAFKGSSVLKFVNNPNAKTGFANIEAAWLVWNKSQGKVMEGLTRRRQAEYLIYSKGIYKKW